MTIRRGHYHVRNFNWHDDMEEGFILAIRKLGVLMGLPCAPLVGSSAELNTTHRRVKQARRVKRALLDESARQFVFSGGDAGGDSGGRRSGSVLRCGWGGSRSSGHSRSFSAALCRSSSAMSHGTRLSSASKRDGD